MMFDRLKHIFRTKQVRRWQICPTCNIRKYDSKWNHECEPCWESKK
jgi:hypothetical protein